jgi:hypothetical protein
MLESTKNMHAGREATKSKRVEVEVESAAKPRELLPAFTQAGIPPHEGISATQEKKDLEN